MVQDVDNNRENPFLSISSGAERHPDFFPHILDQMVDALVFMDRELVIRYANEPFYDLFGYREEDIIGQNLRVLGMDDKFADLSPEQIAGILEKQKYFQGEVLRRSKDGHFIPVLVSTKVTYDNQGEIEGFIGTYQDLRKIRQTELKLKNSLYETIDALTGAIENRDLYKKHHHGRVNELCVAIALDLDKDTTFIEGLSMAAILHDIGKIYVPSEILNFAGSLTDREWELVKTHPTVGYEILRDVDLPWPVAEIVLQHHERLDGSGYPNHLEADEILFPAKILIVADVLESMYADRPNRRGHNIEKCLSHLEDNRGVLYDREIVDVCINLVQSGRFVPSRR